MMTSKLTKKELNKTMLRSCGCSFYGDMKDKEILPLHMQ